MSSFEKQLIRLGSTNPELRAHIRPVLAALGSKTLDQHMGEYLSDLPKELADAAKSHPSLGKASHNLISAKIGDWNVSFSIGIYKTGKVPSVDAVLYLQGKYIDEQSYKPNTSAKNIVQDILKIMLGHSE